MFFEKHSSDHLLCRADDPVLPRTHGKLGEKHKIILFLHVCVMSHMNLHSHTQDMPIYM